MACEAGYENSSTAFDLYTSSIVYSSSLGPARHVACCDHQKSAFASFCLFTICLLPQVLQCIFPFHSSC